MFDDIDTNMDLKNYVSVNWTVIFEVITKNSSLFQPNHGTFKGSKPISNEDVIKFADDLTNYFADSCPLNAQVIPDGDYVLIHFVDLWYVVGWDLRTKQKQSTFLKFLMSKGLSMFDKFEFDVIESCVCSMSEEDQKIAKSKLLDDLKFVMSV